MIPRIIIQTPYNNSNTTLIQLIQPDIYFTLQSLDYFTYDLNYIIKIVII